MLNSLEADIDKFYSEKTKDIGKDLESYFNSFKAEDEVKQKQVESGELTEYEYKQWKLSIINSRKTRKIINKASREYTKINKEALKKVNSSMLSFYEVAYKGNMEDLKEQLSG